nr:hypothetical protein [Tanacetum cinerariifolium]
MKYRDNVKGRREKSLSSRKSHDTGASYVMVMELMAWQTDYCIMKENVHTKRKEILLGGKGDNIAVLGGKGDHEIGTYDLATDYGIMKEKCPY